jgi:hypothetical protein
MSALFVQPPHLHNPGALSSFYETALYLFLRFIDTFFFPLQAHSRLSTTFNDSHTFWRTRARSGVLGEGQRGNWEERKGNATQTLERERERGRGIHEAHLETQSAGHEIQPACKAGLFNAAG